MDDTKVRLKALAFRITNIRPGGVFYTLLEMANQGLADLYQLLKDQTRQQYIDTATGQWLDFRAAEYNVFRKLAQKTLGVVVFRRSEAVGNLPIHPGTVVATPIDRHGNRLQFIVTALTVLEEGQLEVAVPVEAEFAGANYNVGTGLITQLVTYIPGIETVTNGEDWITREGTDDEGDESLRARAKNKWIELSASGGRDAYIGWAKSINGVASVQVDDTQPRGQGTVDVIITGTAGIPTQALIDEVQAHVNKKKPLCTDVLVLGPAPVEIYFDVILHLHPDYGDLATAEAQAREIIDSMFRYGDTENNGITKVSSQFGLIRNVVISNLMTIEHVVNVTLNFPATDMAVTTRELAVKGTVHVVAQRMS